MTLLSYFNTLVEHHRASKNMRDINISFKNGISCSFGILGLPLALDLTSSLVTLFQKCTWPHFTSDYLLIRIVLYSRRGLKVIKEVSKLWIHREECKEWRILETRVNFTAEAKACSTIYRTDISSQLFLLLDMYVVII